MIINTSNVSDTKNRFIILSQQRAGTHLLATLLDSHPELSVYDEYYAKASNYILPVKPIEKLREHEGIIVMYNQLISHGLDVDKFKIVHLTRRDKDAQARSHLKIMKGGTVHTENSVDEDITVTDDEVQSHMESIKHRESRIKNFIPDDVFEISYEDITGGGEVTQVQLPDLLAYLGVSDEVLTTNLKKIANNNSGN